MYSLVGVPGECILSSTFNLTRRIRLEYPEKKIIKSKGKISYLKGFLNDGEVFVKRIPKMDMSLKAISVYKKICNSDHVAKLLLDESDDQYVYLAFEMFRGKEGDETLGWEEGDDTMGGEEGDETMGREEGDGTLAAFIRDNRGHSPDQQRYLSYVASEKYGSFLQANFVNAVKITLLEVVQSSPILNWYDQISFLKDASDEIFAKKLSGIEREASKFFTDNWESKIDENKNAKMWFSLMKEVPEKTKEEVQESKEMEEVHEKRFVRGRVRAAMTEDATTRLRATVTTLPLRYWRHLRTTAATITTPPPPTPSSPSPRHHHHSLHHLTIISTAFTTPPPSLSSSPPNHRHHQNCTSRNMTITCLGMTPKAIEELVNWRVEEALAAYEETRAANALEAER
ncbi:hypothetical protein Tco_1533257 [Tanacetum coccineum]